MERRLNLGCGRDILPGYLNVDGARLPGVDLVVDLRQFPWPLPDNHFEQIRMINVLEHLPDTIRTMEEVHRIAVPGGRVVIRVPYWNCWQAIGDPTHMRQFHQTSFNFFDPRKRQCRERPYYSTARFRIEHVAYFVNVGKWVRVANPLLKAPLAVLANFLNNVIWVLEFRLQALKERAGGVE